MAWTITMSSTTKSSPNLSLVRWAALCWAAIVVLLATSCRKPDVFDVGLNPPANVGYLDSVQVELTTYVPPLDSLFTKNQSYMVLGSYLDPLLGRVTGEIYTQFSLGGEFVFFPADAVIDSVVLILPLDSYYGKPTSPLQFEVNQLTESLNSATNYYATSSVAYDATNLAGSYTFVQPTDSFKLDTIRIRLPDALGQSILDADVNGPLANNSNFHDFFKGLRISATPTNPADVGAMYTVALRNQFVSSARPAAIRLHYSVAGVPQTTYNLSVQPSVSTRFNRLERSDTTGTLYEQLVGRQVPQAQQQAALQSVVPIRVRARIRNLPTQRLAINRAILELPLDTTTLDNNPFRYFRPITSDLYFIPAASDSVTPDFSFFIEAYADYNSTSARYEFDVSAYFHLLMQGTADDHGFLILPVPYAYSARSQGGFLRQNLGSTQRSILHNWNHPERRPRLRVHYTEIP